MGGKMPMRLLFKATRILMVRANFFLTIFSIDFCNNEGKQVANIFIYPFIFCRSEGICLGGPYLRQKFADWVQKYGVCAWAVGRPDGMQSSRAIWPRSCFCSVGPKGPVAEVVSSS